MAVKRHRQNDPISPSSPNTKKRVFRRSTCLSFAALLASTADPQHWADPPAPLNAGPRLPSTHFHPAGRVFGVKIRGRNWAQERSNGEPPLFSTSWQSSPAGGTGRTCFTMGREAAKKKHGILASVSSGIEQFSRGVVSRGSAVCRRQCDHVPCGRPRPRPEGPGTRDPLSPSLARHREPHAQSRELGSRCRSRVGEGGTPP